jgi:mono/diheme cytochrome c family protein
MKLMRAVVFLALILICIGAIGLGVLMHMGVSARDEPSGFETTMAGHLRHLAIPKDARARTSPLPGSAENVKDGMEHFADHCAVCHANNGSADTPFGRGLYPRPPDLRGARTQQLSDGELFWIINNGVKLTGMPAFMPAGPHQPGDEEHTDEDTWKLVAFIRHLPTITDAEVNAMKKLNPHTADEDQEQDHHHHGDEK